MANVLPVINQKGPLPLTATVKVVSDGPMVLMFSGSVWSTTGQSMIGAGVLLDGVRVATATIFANPGATHMAVVPVMVPIQTTFGEHTFEIVPLSGTTTDFNDNFALNILF